MIDFFRKLNRKVLVVFFLLAGSIFLFAFIADEAVLEKENGFDLLVSDFITTHSTPALIRFMKGITFFGSSNFLLPAFVILVGYLLIERKYRHCLALTLVAISSAALVYGLKLLFHRNRPDMPLIQKLSTYSFPSGHAFSSFIFCSLLIYLLHGNKKITPIFKWMLSAFLLLFSLTIGISRIVLRVHYATDIIAGFCLGIAWMILWIWTLKRTLFQYSNIA